MPEGIAEDAPIEGIADNTTDEKQEDEVHEGSQGIAEDADSKQPDTAEDGKEKTDGKNDASDWELAAPENFPLPEENLKSFGDTAKKLGLTKEQAEGMLNWHKEFHESVTGMAQAEQARIIADWQKELNADAEFGGAWEKATVAEARKALAAFDTDGSLRAMLRDSGYQYNPAVVRVIARVGRAMGEHDFITPKGGGSAQKPLHERMYPNMKV